MSGPTSSSGSSTWSPPAGSCSSSRWRSGAQSVERSRNAPSRPWPASIRTRVTWIGLDVETAESAEQLARYSTDAGFDFTYVIADRDVSRALADEFGDVVLNPPATNVIVIEPNGEVTHTTGGHSADELVEIATAALS